MPSAAVVVNRTLVRDLGRFRRRCREAAAASGWELSFVETAVDDPGLGQARGAIAAGARMVVAAGGDGTVRACAHALAGTRVPLAIVPLGTANLAARALGVPPGTRGALAAVFGGQERRIDLAAAGPAGAARPAGAAGSVDSAGPAGAAGALTFAAMAGIGLDAQVVAATPRLLKRRVGWLAYAAAGAAHLPGRGVWFTVRLDDGEPLARRARCVVVGNAGVLPGGFVLLPRARLDDGVLDVGILAPVGAGGWLRVAHRVVSGGGRDGPQLETHQARRIEITAETRLPREVDGEVITPGRSLTVTLLRCSLTVRVPPSRGWPGPRC
jgi:diacylglycerol kinase family enzyme